MQTLLAIIFIILAVWILWNAIGKNLLMRYLNRKAEDMMRRTFGFPPREDKKQRASGSSAKQRAERTSAFRQGRRKPQSHSADEPIIPREYAVDVEYVEIKEFKQTEIGTDKNGKHVRVEEYHESQVSDVEWEDIKK